MLFRKEMFEWVFYHGKEFALEFDVSEFRFV